MARNRCTDRDAANMIRALRIDHGFSPEQLSQAIQKKAIEAGEGAGRFYVTGRTIRLIEETGREPTERVKFAIAFYFDRRVGHIWRRHQIFDRDRERATA